MSLLSVIRIFSVIIVTSFLLSGVNPLLSSINNNQTLFKLVSLEYSSKELQQLRSEVKKNLSELAAGNQPQVKFREYQIKKEDTFFSVMSRTMLNHDTLSSVNQLSSLWDLKAKDRWLIPNARGVAVTGSLEEIKEKYRVSADQITPVPGHDGYYFVAGKKFDHDERKYLNLAVFIRPVAGVVSSKYGYRNDPFTRKSKFHKGIDIACPTGSTVVASASGRVIYTGEKGGYGNTVMVEHENGYITLYGHLSTISVKYGDRVDKGEKIALSGQTGRVTGPHLHFEVKRRGKNITPHFKMKS